MIMTSPIMVDFFCRFTLMIMTTPINYGSLFFRFTLKKNLKYAHSIYIRNSHPCQIKNFQSWDKKIHEIWQNRNWNYQCFLLCRGNFHNQTLTYNSTASNGHIPHCVLPVISEPWGLDSTHLETHLQSKNVKQKLRIPLAESRFIIIPFWSKAVTATCQGWVI